MKSKLSAALVLLFTFALGAIAGSVGYSLYQKRVAAKQMVGPPRTSHLADELAKGLDLDENQKEKLHEILKNSRQRYLELSKQFRPQYQALRSQTREEIRQILRDDQKTRFEEVMSQVDDRHRPPKGRP